MVAIFCMNPSINTAQFFWPIGDRINGVPLYIVCTEMDFCAWHTRVLLLSLTLLMDKLFI